MHFQLLCSKVYVQMVPVNLYKGKMPAFFFSKTLVTQLTPLHFPLVAI